MYSFQVKILSLLSSPLLLYMRNLKSRPKELREHSKYSSSKDSKIKTIVVDLVGQGSTS